MLHAAGITHDYRSRGRAPVPVLDDVTLDAPPGLTVLRGVSGSGKSTLLTILGGLRRPTRGSVRFHDGPVSPRGGSAFVFQHPELLPYLTAAQNAAVHGGDATPWLERLGLTHRAAHRPGRLSVGEARRVTLARALAVSPRLLLADEPTAHLDPDAGDAVWQVLREQADGGVTVIAATHARDVPVSTDRSYHLEHGKLRDAS